MRKLFLALAAVAALAFAGQAGAASNATKTIKIFGSGFSPSSATVTAPKVTLGRNNGWIIHAAGGRSFAGRAVQFQRLNSATGQWVTLRKVLLNSKSSARVNYVLPKGMNHLRVTLSVNQAGAGFLGVIGPTVNWRMS